MGENPLPTKASHQEESLDQSLIRPRNNKSEYRSIHPCDRNVRLAFDERYPFGEGDTNH
jgi:hypothetical protein